MVAKKVMLDTKDYGDDDDGGDDGGYDDGGADIWFFFRSDDTFSLTNARKRESCNTKHQWQRTKQRQRLRQRSGVAVGLHWG